MTSFVTQYHNEDIVDYIDAKLKEDVAKAYPEVAVQDDYDLMDTLQSIVEATGRMFIFIIDEWDAICREFDPASPIMTNYVNWLRRLFKTE